MEQKYNTSFIPKKFLADNVGGGGSSTQYVSRRSVMGPGYYLTVLIFVLVLMASGGIFAYVKITQQRIAALTEEMNKQTAVIPVEQIEALILLNRRLGAAGVVLNNHVAASRVLGLLEEKTIRDIRYVTFEYIAGEGGQPSITLTGESPDFKQVALQAKQFEQSSMLTNSAVTELGYSSDESSSFVQFGIQATINPTLVSYGSSPQRTDTSRTEQPQNSEPTSPIIEPAAGTSTGASL